MQIMLKVFILLLLTAQVLADTRQGVDVLGLAKYCETYLQAPKMEAVSTLMGTFGDPLPCIEKRIQAGGLKVVQIDLRDATCFRNRVCPRNTPPLTDWVEMKRRAVSVGKLAAKYPQVEWFVSPYLEHDIKEEAVIRKACSVALEGCPSCKCINSPVSGVRPRDIPLELHGTRTRAFAVSGDGASSFDGDNIASDGNRFEHRISGSDQTYMWWPELNLRCTGEKKFTAPDRRSEKPTKDQFIQAYLISLEEAPKPQPPAVCKKVVEVNAKNGEILKTNAESYCNGVKGDARANKPMLILRRQGKAGERLKIYSKEGREVGCFKYYGPFETKGLFRYYEGDCSKLGSVNLYNRLGSEWGFAELGGGNCLLINAIRRLGVYR